MKKLILFLIFATSPLFGTGFAISSVTVLGSTTTGGTSACLTAGACSGWVAEIATSNTVTAGGTYALGFSQGTNFKPTAANIVLTCTSSGYTNAGGATTYTRTIYGTRQLRQPYSTFQTNDEFNNGTTTMVLRIALSDIVYSTEVCTAVIAASIYTSGVNTTNSFSGSVTNNSNVAYSTARVIANWSRPGWQRITGSTLTLAAVAFQRHARNNLPVAAVVFTVADAHAHSNSVTVTAPTIDPSQGDGPTYTVTGTVTSGTFTTGEQLKQTSTGALAYLVNAPVGSASAVITTPLGNPTSSNTWVGQTSAAVFTPNALPAANLGLTNIVEYIANVPTTGFTQGDKLTANFKAYPWIGDSTSVMDTSDAVNSQPTPLYAPQFYVWDGAQTYGTAVAVVDSSQTITGSKTSGTFIVGEKVTQTTSGAVAYINNSPTGVQSLIIGATVSGTPTATATWTGATSAAVYTPTAIPAAVGSDSNSCAVAEATYVQGTTPGGGACKTINGAAVKMAAFNNATSTRNDACGSMYLKQGGYNWTGAAAAVSNTTANCWANIQPFSGVLRGQVVIQQQNGTDLQSFGTQCTTGSTGCGTPIHLKNLTVNVPTNPTSIFSNITYLWFDNTVISATATAVIYQDTVVYFTQGAVPAINTGLYPFGTTNMSMALIRGTDLTGGLGQIYWYTILGTVNLSTTTQLQIINELASQTNPASKQPIFAFNGMWRMSPASQTTLTGSFTTSGVLGEVVAQNIFENNFTNQTLSMVSMAADSSTATPNNNVMLWHNVIVGGRMNRGYNDSGTLALFRTAWSEVGDLRDLDAIKSDTFGTQSANRVGNWAVMYGVGRRSVATAELSGGTTGWTGTASFRNEFPGVFVYEPAWGGTNANGTSTTSPIASAVNTTINFFTYNNRLAFDGTSANAGYGDYRLKSSSNVVNFIPSGQGVLPFDFAGQLRNNSGLGSAGAYEQAIIATQTFGW